MSKRDDIYAGMWRELTGTDATAIKSDQVAVKTSKLRMVLAEAAAEMASNAKRAKMLKKSLTISKELDRRAREAAAYDPATPPSWSTVPFIPWGVISNGATASAPTQVHGEG